MFSCSSPNEKGISSSILNIFCSSLPLVIITSRSWPQSSKRTCLHAPHGGIKSLLSEVIAMAENSYSPANFAAKAAVRSAQIEEPKIDSNENILIQLLNN